MVKNKYRIVEHLIRKETGSCLLYYRVEIKRWWFPIWCQLGTIVTSDEEGALKRIANHMLHGHPDWVAEYHDEHDLIIARLGGAQ